MGLLRRGLRRGGCSSGALLTPSAYLALSDKFQCFANNDIQRFADFRSRDGALVGEDVPDVLCMLACVVRAGPGLIAWMKLRQGQG